MGEKEKIITEKIKKKHPNQTSCAPSSKKLAEKKNIKREASLSPIIK